MTTEPALTLDTSVAIPLLVASHEAHAAVTAWVDGRAVSLSGHALPETYAVLTRLPGDARVTPDDAVTLIDSAFPTCLTLDEPASRTAHRELARCGVQGGATYDGLVALVARQHGATLVTRDARAHPTYEAVGARVELLHAPGPASHG